VRASLIRFHRNQLGNRERRPDAITDAWLLANFPGRTLEELDTMNWGRYLRAQMALHVRSVEEKRLMHMQSLIKSDQMRPADWEAIAEHERILAAWPTPE
jgi:hypothetical protein